MAQAGGGGLVDDDRRVRVQLQSGSRAEGAHAALAGLLDRFGLALAEGQQHQVTGLRIVPMPCVMQWVGTWLMSSSKKRALSTRVCSASVLTRVPEASDEPAR